MSYSKIISGVSITILVCVIIGMIIISVLMSYQMFDNIKHVKTATTRAPNQNPTVPSMPSFFGVR